VTGFYPARKGNGLRNPKISTVGGDVAGSVEAVGSDVHAFHPGDEVFGVAGGAWAEYASAREARLAPKPALLSPCLRSVQRSRPASTRA
jgi:NADPH:quinone reductase-like Zn-dependent oxidoreductase